MEMAFDLGAPHTEAQEFIEDKPAVAKVAFDKMLPELRGRAFTITGIEGANVVQRVRDSIAGLATGATWDEVKGDVAGQLDDAGFSEEGAQKRAEILMRTHGFQAFQSANWRAAQEDEDTTHLQYLATEDDRVRPTHLALNGIVLPKDDPFWDKHYPPWEWGCRCRVRSMNPDQVDEEKDKDEKKNPEDRNVIEGPARRQLENGTLLRDGQRYDVTAPSDGPDAASAFRWNPDDLRIPIKELEQRYDPDVFAEFEDWAKKEIGSGGTSLWDYLEQRRLPKIQRRGEPALPELSRLPITSRAAHRLEKSDAEAQVKAGASVKSNAGTRVEFGQILARHFSREEGIGAKEDERARFLPAARRTVAGPVEVWQKGQRRYYIGRMLRDDGGAVGFVVVTTRTAEDTDEVITFFPKGGKDLEKFRSGELIYRAGK